MGGPNSFCRGTRDKFGNLFGVHRTRGERAFMQASWDKPRSIKSRQASSITQRKRPITKVTFKFLEGDA